MRRLIFICFASAAWALSFGVGSQATSHWLHARDASNTVIGVNHSCYYFGLALAALVVPTAIRRWGTGGVAVVGFLFCGVTLIAFPWGGGVAGWCALRFLNGSFSALALIPVETLVSRGSRPNERTRNFAFYAVALTLGGALGIWAGLHLFEQLGEGAFYLGGSAALLAAFILGAAGASDENADNEPETVLAWRLYLLSFGTAWYQGFLEGGMLAFLSLYLLSLGLSADLAGGMMGATMVGVILFQVPVSWLADRFGLVPILLACYAVVGLGLAAVPFLEAGLMLAVCLLGFGAASGALYPLGLALLGDRDNESGVARAYAWYMAMECVGSQMGAAAMGTARDWWGGPAMFAVGLGAMAVALVPWLLVRRATTAKENEQITMGRAA